MVLTNSAIDRIGVIIRNNDDGPDKEEAIRQLDNWRAMHGKAMTVYYKKSIRLAKKLGIEKPIVAERLKRLPTIIKKLNRFKDMRLSSMQDVAGVRIVVKNMDQLKKAERSIRRWKGLLPNKTKNYIDNPKKDGYRGKHFIFKTDGMYVEVQLRTFAQHMWATAVETTDMFHETSIKMGEDSTYWSVFFRTVSEAFAMIDDNSFKTDQKAFNKKCTEIKRITKKHKILHSIETMKLSEEINKIIMKESKEGVGHYVILDLDYRKKKCKAYIFKEEHYRKAVKQYQDLEKNLRREQNVVLIAINDIKEIEEAYPNYALKLDTFQRLLAIFVPDMLSNKLKKATKSMKPDTLSTLK